MKTDLEQQNAHYYAFLNAPLHAKAGWTRAQIAKVQGRLNAGGYPSADAYHDDKDHLRRLAAGLAGKSEREHDPMGFWFGRQSN